MLKIKIGLIALALLVITYFTVPYWTYETKVVNIVNTAVKQNGETGKYLIFTEQGVYENTDTWYYFKFNSSDVQAVMMRPGKVRIKFYGFRVPFFSKYQNIVSAERVL